MRMRSLLPAATLGLAAMLGAQVGQALPDVKLKDFTGTAATSLEAFSGRLILLEFFAFW